MVALLDFMQLICFSSYESIWLKIFSLKSIFNFIMNLKKLCKSICYEGCKFASCFMLHVNMFCTLCNWGELEELLLLQNTSQRYMIENVIILTSGFWLFKAFTEPRMLLKIPSNTGMSNGSNFGMVVFLRDERTTFKIIKNCYWNEFWNIQQKKLATKINYWNSKK